MLLRTRQPGHRFVKPEGRLGFLHGVPPPLELREAGRSLLLPGARNRPSQPVEPDMHANRDASAA
jgi:hypothetical protein